VNEFDRPALYEMKEARAGGYQIQRACRVFVVGE
jgi:hypothetical protein